MEEKYQICYVAFLDILGFKNVVSRYSCAQIMSVFSEIKNSKLKSVHIDKEQFASVRDVNMYIMSDSIVLYINAGVQASMAALVTACSFLQCRLSELNEPIFVRGAISKGQLYRNESIIFGPALTEAYLMENQNAKYPRVIFTKELYLSAKNEQSDTINQRRFDSLLYEDEDEWMCVENMSNCVIPLENTLMLYVQNQLNKQKDSNIREKYLYLKNHYEKVVEKYKKAGIYI